MHADEAMDRILDEYRQQYPPLIDVKQAANIARCPRGTIYDWSSRGLLDAVRSRHGRRMLIDRDGFVRLLLASQPERHRPVQPRLPIATPQSVPPPLPMPPVSPRRKKAQGHGAYRMLDWFWIDEDARVKAFLPADSPRWHVQYNLPGIGQRRHSLRTSSRKEAGLRGRRFARRLAAGETPLQRAPLAEMAALRRQRMAALGRRPASITMTERYDRMLIAHLARSGKAYVDQLTEPVLEDFESTLRSRGVTVPPAAGRRRPYKARPLAAKTVRDCLKCVRSLIRFALKRRLIAFDPSSAYQLPPAPQPQMAIYTSEELAQIHADPKHGDLWRFLTHTALRAGEFIWLRDEDVDFDDTGHPAAVRIRGKQCPRTRREWRPKHDIERVVPLTAEAAGIVARALAGSRSPWLFETPRQRIFGGMGRWDYSTLLAHLHARQDALGIVRRGLHAFRHQGATVMANDSHMPIVQVQRMLGHRSLKTTEQYLHPQITDIAASLARVDFSGAISGDQVAVSEAGGGI